MDAAQPRRVQKKNIKGRATSESAAVTEMKYGYRRRRRAHRRSKKKNAKPKGRKELVRLIKGVSFSTQETKMHTMWWSPYGTVDPTFQVTGDYGFIQGLWSDLPNIKNTFTDTSQSYIGEDIYVKGVRVRMDIPATFASIDDRVALHARMCIIAWQGRIAAGGPVAIPTAFWRPDQMPLQQGRRSFNTHEVNVLWSKNWTFRGPTKAEDYTIQHYHKFGRSFKRSIPDENFASQNHWGYNKNKNYYVIFQYWTSDNSNVTAPGTIQCEKKVYFKDG